MIWSTAAKKQPHAAGLMDTPLKFRLSKPKEDLPYTHIFYAFDTAEGSLVFSFAIYDIHATDSNLKLVNDAAQSIHFN